MANLIKILADIGEAYSDEEKESYNDASNKDLEVLLLDIETKQITPSLNLTSKDFIVCRNSKKSAAKNAPFIYPISYVSKTKEDIIDKIKKSNGVFLSFFQQDEIENNVILKKLSALDDDLFNTIEEILIAKNSKNKVSSYVSLSYQGKPISQLFPEVFDTFLAQSDETLAYGYDMLTNKEGVGGDAGLPFCSVNELPGTMQGKEKARLLPLNPNSSKKVALGWNKVDESLSSTFYPYKIAILPTILDRSIDLKEVLGILEEGVKGKIHGIQQAEEFVLDNYLETTAQAEEHLPVLNTILCYESNQSARIVRITIADVLPSYISHISELLRDNHIKACFAKEEKKDKKQDDGVKTIYLQSLFVDKDNNKDKSKSKLEVMHFLLSRTKYRKSKMIEKFYQLIMKKPQNKTFCWTEYFNGFYKDRTIEVLERYSDFFNEADLLDEKILIKRRETLSKFEKDQIFEVLNTHDFLVASPVLKSAYLLGMLSASIVNWQYGATDKSV